MKKCLFYFLLFAWLGFGTLNAQTITGKVTGEQDKQPLAGVTVLVKNSTIGTVTGVDGKYSVTVPSLDATLVFSFVGMQTIEVPLNNKTVVDVSMVPSVLGLDEVIVTAYGTSKKASFTGSASVTKSSDIQKVQASSVLSTLAGNVSGVQVTNASGQAGINPQIRIRGISSINGVSDPLYVVNGAPFGGDLNSIDPNDVESITVLKDASATALYGSRASGGVILITTKKGTGGAPVVNFKTTYGFSKNALPLHKRVNNAQFYEMRWEANKNGYMDQNPTATLADAETWATANLLPKLGNYNSFDRFPLLANGKIDPAAKPRWGSGPTDWENALLKPGPRSESYLSVSGGTPSGTNYYVSFGYLKDKGYFTNEDFNRASGRIDISTKVKEIFEMGMNTSFARSFYIGPRWLDHVHAFILEVPDIYPVYQWDDAKNTFKTGNDNGKVYDLGGGNEYSYDGLARVVFSNINALQQADEDITSSTIGNLSTRPYIAITPFKGFTIRSQLAVDYRIEQWKDYHNPVRGVWVSLGGDAMRTDNSSFNYTSTSTATYKKSFGKHSIDILGGFEAYSVTDITSTVYGQQLAVPTLNEEGATAITAWGYAGLEKHRILSFLSRVQYNYLEKYFLSVSFRRDGTSRFAPESRWGNFGSIGVSWVLSKEKFLEGISSWLTDANVRFSIGSQGNEQIGGYYAYLGTYDLWSQLGTTALSLSSLRNSSLKWESDIQTNFGFTASLFDRIKIDFDYWVKKSKGLLFHRGLPPSSGVGGVDENIGDVQNKGFDLQMVANIMPKLSEFKWEARLGLSHYTNKITSLPSEIITGYYKYKVGHSVYDYYMPEWRGVNPDNGHALWTNDAGETTENYNEATWDYRGSGIPDLYGNVANTFTYKGFDLYVNVIFQLGSKIYDTRFIRMSGAGSNNLGRTWAAECYDYWTPTNKDAKQPRLTTFAPIGNLYNSTSTRYLVNGTFARFLNITLGYTLPNKLSSRIGIKDARIFLQADNFITFFGMKSRSLDPQTYVGGVGAGRADVTPSKIGTVGISLTF